MAWAKAGPVAVSRSRPARPARFLDNREPGQEAAELNIRMAVPGPPVAVPDPLAVSQRNSPAGESLGQGFVDSVTGI